MGCLLGRARRSPAAAGDTPFWRVPATAHAVGASHRSRTGGDGGAGRCVAGGAGAQPCGCSGLRLAYRGCIGRGPPQPWVHAVGGGPLAGWGGLGEGLCRPPRGLVGGRRHSPPREVSHHWQDDRLNPLIWAWWQGQRAQRERGRRLGPNRRQARAHRLHQPGLRRTKWQYQSRGLGKRVGHGRCA